MEGKIADPYSISVGLYYTGNGHEQSFLKDTNRAKYLSVTDRQALNGISTLSR